MNIISKDECFIIVNDRIKKILLNSKNIADAQIIQATHIDFTIWSIVFDNNKYWDNLLSFDNDYNSKNYYLYGDNNNINYIINGISFYENKNNIKDILENLLNKNIKLINLL